MSGGSPIAATWFADRYLIERSYCNDFVASDERSDPDTIWKIQYLRLTLYDFGSGETFELAPESLESRSTETSFREKVFLPLEDTIQRSPLRAAWDATQAAIDCAPAKAPVSPGDACKVAGLPEPKTTWKKLGVWPPPEIWRISDYDGTPIHAASSGGGGWKPVSESPLLECKMLASGQTLLALKIKTPSRDWGGGHGSTKPPFTDWFTVGRAPLIASGSGHLPEVTSIRTTGGENPCLLIAGKAGFPKGREVQTRRWILLLDPLSHQAWRMDAIE